MTWPWSLFSAPPRLRASATRLNGTLYGQIIPMTVVETAPVQAHRSTRN
jgi:hypothetical protein